jgi:hypothetical protein
VALLSEIHLKPHERFFIPNYHLIGLITSWKWCCIRKVIPHNLVDLPPLPSTEVIEICIPTGNSEVLLAAAYKSPAHTWNDADITEFLSFRFKVLLAQGLNVKHPF